MALILPLCRLLLVAQNVWATYHVLKTPRASRTTGQPSQRALASRKRAMKSCLAVWLVWACIWLGEGPLDSTVGIVMPFYGEAKTLAILGLLLFKSYAAEPIVLHVIRPAIKPYMSTLDGLLDLFALLGGLVVSAVLMPWHALLAWWDAAPRLGDPAVSSSSSGSASSDDDYAHRVALGDRAALQDAHRRANAVFVQIDDAQRRHREYSNSQSRERPAPAPAPAPVPRHSRNSSSSSSVPPAPGAWSYTTAPARPSSRTGHYAPVRQPSATYTQAAQYPSLPRQPSASYTPPAAAPRPPSRTSQYASRPQPQAGPSHERRASGGGSANPYEIWYPPPQRAPSPGSQATQTFYYPTQRQPQQEPIPTPPPPYESVRARRTSAPPETPLRLPGALPFSPPSFPIPLPFPAPAPAPRGFELPPAGEDKGGDGRPRDFIDLTADPPPSSSREKALPSPPPDPDVMEIDALPEPKTRTRSRTRRKRVHEPEPAGAAPEELSGGESDTTNSSIVKKRRVAGGRVARRVAALDDVAERPPPVAPKPPRLKGTAVARKDAEKAPATKSKALAHQAAPPAAATLSASTSTRTTRSSSRTADTAQGLAALDAAAAAAPKRRSRR